jgi:hypothetical protein
MAIKIYKEGASAVVDDGTEVIISSFSYEEENEIITILDQESFNNVWNDYWYRLQKKDGSPCGATLSAVLDYLATVTSGEGGAVQTGIWGISDSSGTYTYYDTIALANASASSGTTIELFADVIERTGVSWDLKDGVKYNLNGHTYQLDVATTEDTLIDTSVGFGEAHVFNGIIKRTGGAVSVNDSRVLFKSANGTIYFEGVHLINDTGVCTRVQAGKVIGGIHESEGTNSQSHGIYLLNTEVENAKAYARTGKGVYNFTGKLINCYAYSRDDYGVNNQTSSAQTINCTAWSDGNYGMNNNNGEVINCTIVSTASTGYSSSGKTTGSNIFSSAGYGTIVAVASVRLNNCTITSTANSAIWALNNDALAQDCTIISTASRAIRDKGRYYNCSIESQWNNASGDAIGIINAEVEVFGCSLTVLNASANCIGASTAQNAKYGNNIFKGATTAVNANITQSQSATHDNRGNIQIS